METAPSAARSYAAAMACAVCAGFAYTAFKLVRPDVPPFTTLLVMSVVSTAAFVAVRGLAAGTWAPPRLDGPSRRILFIQTGFTFFGIWGLWTGVRLMDPAAASFLGRTETLFSLIFGVVLLGERFRRAEIPGAVLAVAGVGVMICDGLGRVGAAAFGTGTAAMLGGAAVMGLSEVWSKRAMARVAPLDFALCRAALLTAAYAVVGTATGGLVLPEPGDLLFISLAALLAPTAARLLFLTSLRRLPLAKAVTVNLTQPLFAGLLALVWLGTSPPAIQWAGGLVTLLGCGLLVHARRG